MTLPSKAAKVTLGIKAGKGVANNPGVVRGVGPMTKAGATAGTSFAKRQARRRVEQLGEATRAFGGTLAACGPRAALALGLIEPPKRKRTGPVAATGLAVGVLIGASAMYFLEPGSGREHRQRVVRLVASH
jgi:hypothetical protein